MGGNCREISQHEGVEELKIQDSDNCSSSRSYYKLNNHLFFDHWPDDLNDRTIIENTHAVLSHFQEQKVDLCIVSLGLDAARDDLFGANITPNGYREVARILRRNNNSNNKFNFNGGLSFPVVFVLEGGYRTEGGRDSVFGKCVEGVIGGLIDETI